METFIYGATQPELLITWAVVGPLWLRATLKWIRAENAHAAAKAR